jgi:flagellar hook-basal body complex protein FliE
MISKINSQANIQSMLETLRSHQTQASNRLQGLNDGAAPAQSVDFGQSIQRVLQQVNETQLQSDQQVSRYERGEDVPLTDVVLSMQKASLSFEATLQVRNKVMKAYEDILNMPV